MARVVFLVVLAALASVSGRCPSYEGKENDCFIFPSLNSTLREIGLPALNEPRSTLIGLSNWLRENYYKEEARAERVLRKHGAEIAELFKAYEVSIEQQTSDA